MRPLYRTLCILLACTLAAPSVVHAIDDADSVDEEFVDDEEDSVESDDDSDDDADDADSPNERETSAPSKTVRKGKKLQTTAKRTTRFIEVSGAFGVQFGTTPYVPNGDGSTSHHPMTNGTAAGVSAGFELLKGLMLFGNYEQTSASSVDGQVANALDKIDGLIDYQTVVVGLRSVRRIGPGWLFGELAAGVVLPFQTQLQYVYAAPLSGLPVPVQGVGTKTDEYNLGFGAHGAFGYQLDVTSSIYLTTAIKLKGFATTNDGRKTRLDNFVTDFAAPMPVTAEVEYQSGATSPSTYSVQDLRAQVAIGLRF